MNKHVSSYDDYEGFSHHYLPLTFQLFDGFDAVCSGRLFFPTFEYINATVENLKRKKTNKQIHTFPENPLNLALFLTL